MSASRAAVLAALLLSPPLVAQEPAPIQDNSFLIEEAYNQEAGVVQHISTLALAEDGGDWAFSFTQEWPLGALEHQLSYTVPLLRAGGQQGLGDVAINYRYQLVGGPEDPVAFAPRISLLLPTGDEDEGLGSAALGAQLNLPLSAALSRAVVGHWNAGATILPGAENAAGEAADLDGYFLGQSLIWLLRPRFNLMLEALWSRSESVAGPGRAEADESFFVSPGLRYAQDFASGLQVVYGLAAPIGVGSSNDQNSVFLYLSLEHPF